MGVPRTMDELPAFFLLAVPTQPLSGLKNVKGSTLPLPLVCRLPTLELV